MNQNDDQLKQIRDEVIDCKKCDLWRNRTLPVVGQGNHYASIMFIGEGPGQQEDQTGCPFCGRSGNILDTLLKSVSLKRKDVYISNIVKCRPPGNRDPFPKEILACTDFLVRQINLINPKVICTLGRHSMAWVFQEFNLGIPDYISKCHGQVWKVNDKLIIPLYHPAVATYNSNMITTLLKDVKILKEYGSSSIL